MNNKRFNHHVLIGNIKDIIPIFGDVKFLNAT